MAGERLALEIRQQRGRQQQRQGQRRRRPACRCGQLVVQAAVSVARMALEQGFDQAVLGVVGEQVGRGRRALRRYEREGAQRVA